MFQRTDLIRLRPLHSDGGGFQEQVRHQTIARLATRVQIEFRLDTSDDAAPTRSPAHLFVCVRDACASPALGAQCTAALWRCICANIVFNFPTSPGCSRRCGHILGRCKFDCTCKQHKGMDGMICPCSVQECARIFHILIRTLARGFCSFNPLDVNPRWCQPPLLSTSCSAHLLHSSTPYSVNPLRRQSCLLPPHASVNQISYQLFPVSTFSSANSFPWQPLVVPKILQCQTTLVSKLHLASRMN